MFRSIALSTLLALSCAAGTRADTILQFGQADPHDRITATEAGGVTSLSTAGNADGADLSVPVLITNFLGTPVVGIAAFETFVNVRSAGPAAVVSGQVIQPYVGVVIFSSLPGGLGADYLTAAFTDLTMSGTVSGTATGSQAQLSATEPPQLLTLKSDFATGFAGPSSMTLGFSNLSPSLADLNGSIRGFTAQNAGTIAAAGATAVSEPSTLVLAALGAVTALVASGRRRPRKSRRDSDDPPGSVESRC